LSKHPKATFDGAWLCALSLLSNDAYFVLTYNSLLAKADLSHIVRPL
jgi:hypothetical protein